MSHSDSDTPEQHSRSSAQRTALRARFRAARQQLDSQIHRAHGVRLAEHWQTLREPLGANATVALYVTRDGEIDSGPLRNELTAQGVAIALPCVNQAARDLVFRRYEGEDRLVIGPYDIPEPQAQAPVCTAATLTLMFLPLVAFDDRGTRLGMGGGYYDRYLGALSNDQRPILIGLAHSVQRSARPLPRARWDVPLDAVLTETGLTQFSSTLLR
ncbi:MAG: 5-formyltetrahydrofolate cyclo-ligase [Pseudomonadota bacterium]